MGKYCNRKMINKIFLRSVITQKIQKVLNFYFYFEVLLMVFATFYIVYLLVERFNDRCSCNHDGHNKHNCIESSIRTTSF